MHKDILMFLDEHKEKAQRIVDLFLEDSVRYGYSGRIHISGISGTGKSEIAQLVHRKLYELGICSFVLNLDKFYKIPAERRKIWRKDTGIIGHEEYDWDAIEKELIIFDNNSIRVLIIEGLYAHYVEGGLSFYIEGNIESTDSFRRLRKKEPEESDWRQYVVGCEYADILANKHKCDHVI